MYGSIMARIICVSNTIENIGDAVAKFWWERTTTPEPDSFPDWKGEYWSNRHLDGNPTVVRNDRKIDFNWGTGSPDSRIPSNDFSARWTRKIDFDKGTYRFYAKSDDGVRVYVDDDRIINEWYDNTGDETFTCRHRSGWAGEGES